MMKDVIIKISGDSQIYLNKKTLGINGENLQGNIVFQFTNEFVNGIAWLETQMPNGEKGYLECYKKDNEYYLPILSSLLKQVGNITMQLRITKDENINGIPIFKSNKFYLEVKEAINSIATIPEEYPQWIDIANAKIIEIDESLNDMQEVKSYVTEQADYAKETADNLNTKLNNGELNGATFIPNLDEEGNLSWTNNKNLENPQTQNIRGPQGVMGPQGEAFKIKKTYSSKEEMLADFENMEIGDYVMITSNIEVEDNAKLYSKGETEWVFITDFSGATGIQGPQGPQGIQGIQGPTGPKGDKPVKYVDYFTEAEQNEMVAEITDNANSVFNQNVIEKTNEFNANAETKVNEFNETVDSLQEEIDDLYNNQMFNEASGESIHITDSANAKVDYLEIEGNSYQETEPTPDNPSEVEVIEAYNLIPFTYQTQTINGVEFLVNEDGTITVNGTATANAYFNLGKPTLQKGDYILTGLPSAGSSSSFKITFKFEDVQQNLFGTEGKTFTINEEATAQEYYLFIANGYTANNLVFKPMIAKGTKVRPYSPYGKIGIKTIGKNLLSQNNAEFTIYKQLNIEPISAGTYTISGNIVSSDTDNHACLIIFSNSETKKEISLYVNRGDFSKTITLTTEINGINIYASNTYINSVDDTAIFKDLMISKDGGEYEPYKEEITYIDLKGNFAGKLPNGTKDRLYIENNHLYLEKRVGKVVLNGSEGWGISNVSTDNYKDFYIYLNSMSFNSITISNYFKHANKRGADNCIWTPYKDELDISINSSIATNVDEFKQWLSENNVTVYYELAEPQIIDLGYIKTPKTLENTSNISLLANLETNMSLKYVQHTRTILDNIQNQINNIMTAIIPENEEVE